MSKKLNNIYISRINYNIFIYIINKRLGDHRVVKYKIVPKKISNIRNQILKINF